MESLKPPAPGHRLAFLAFLSLAGYILVFLILGGKIGPAVASFSTIPVMLFGWAFGPWVGFFSGLLAVPLNTLLFNQIGIPGIDVVFRVGGGPGSFMLILMGVATGIVHRLTVRLAQQIAALRSAEASLRESEARYRNLLNHIPQKIFYKNSRLEYIGVNPSYAAGVNRTPEDVVGATDFDLYPSNIAEKYRSDDRRVLATGIPEEFDEEYIEKGEPRSAHTVKVPVRDQQGAITGIMGIFWDITERKQVEMAREKLLAENRRQRELLERIIQETPAGIAFLEGPDYRYSLVNPGYLEFVRGKGEILGCTVAEVWPEAIDALQPLLDQVYRTGKAFHAVDMPFTTLRDRGPETAYFTFTYTPIFGETGCVDSLLVTAQETTEQIEGRHLLEKELAERKKAEAIAEMQATQADALAEIANALTAASLDADAIYAVITRQTAHLIGDACLLTLISEDQARIEIASVQHTNPSVAARMLEIIPRGSIHLGEGIASQVMRTGKPLIVPAVRQDHAEPLGEPGYEPYFNEFKVESLLIVPILAHGQVIGTLGVMRDHPGTPYSLEDLSLLRYLANQAALPMMNARLHEQIKQQANTDALTGVPNRRHFNELAGLEYQRAQRYGYDLGLIMMDIDHFKSINDTYGHDAGDQVLVQVAGLCHISARAIDLISRYGGDEFLILLPETDPAGTRAIAERLCHAIDHFPILRGAETIRITASLGVAGKSDATTDLDQMLHQADQALYLAKRAGRNQVKSWDEEKA